MSEEPEASTGYDIGSLDHLFSESIELAKQLPCSGGADCLHCKLLHSAPLVRLGYCESPKDLGGHQARKEEEGVSKGSKRDARLF
jgi:hypothetical protein